MLNSQQNFLMYLDALQKELGSVGIDNDNVSNLIKVVTETELIVPVVGAFSAGKSSLINSFLGRDYLSVGLPPETALAAELRYSARNYVEAVKDDGSTDEYSISDMKQINSRAADYKYLKVFLNNDAVKKLEPVILVDMPGFDAPLDIHSRAIVEYLDKGVYYIVLTSVEDGTITTSMVRHLNDIIEYGRDFSFFVSKSNLRADSEVNDVVSSIESQISDDLGFSKKIVPIGNNGGDDLKKVLGSLDPEKLCQDVFKPLLKDNYNTVISDLNLRSAALQKDNSENEEAIKQLQDKVQSIIHKRDNMLEEAKDKYSDYNVNRIAEAVGRDLSSSVDELVATAVSGGQEALGRSVNEIIRSSLIYQIKTSVGEISDSIVGDFSLELQGIESTMKSFSMNDSWLEQLTGIAKNMFTKFDTTMGEVVKERYNSNKAGVYKAITSVLAITTEVLNPILELLIVFLPDILSALFDNIQKKKQAEQVRSVLLTSIIPSVKRKVRESLPATFDEQVNNIINKISDNFNEALESQQQSIAAMEEEKRISINEITEKLATLSSVIERINSAAKSTLYQGAN